MNRDDGHRQIPTCQGSLTLKIHDVLLLNLHNFVGSTTGHLTLASSEHPTAVTPVTKYTHERRAHPHNPDSFHARIVALRTESHPSLCNAPTTHYSTRDTMSSDVFTGHPRHHLLRSQPNRPPPSLPRQYLPPHNAYVHCSPRSTRALHPNSGASPVGGASGGPRARYAHPPGAHGRTRLVAAPIDRSQNGR